MTTVDRFTATDSGDGKRILRRMDRFTVALLLIAFVGLVWRVGYVLWLRNNVLIGDGYVYHYSAIDLVSGVGFHVRGTGQDIASHPPAWPVLLAVPTRLGLRSWLSQQLFTCLIGTAAIVMVGLAAKAAFGRRVGVVAAVLAAVYPLMWHYERELLAEPLVLLGVATTVWLAYRFRARPGLALAISMGLAVGVMAMTSAQLVLISVLVVLPLVLSARVVALRRRFVWLAAAAVACVVVMAPWAIYNSTRFANPVPFSTAAGAELGQGNCPATYHGKLLGYYALGCILFVKNLDPDFSVRDGQYRKEALKYIKANESRLPVVIAARVGRTFGVFRPGQQVHLEAGESGTPLWVLRLGFAMYWALIPFAIAGAVLARRRGVPVYPLLGFPLEVLIAVVPTIGSVRYRAPAEITLIILAAVGIEVLLSRKYAHSVAGVT